jgi:hypothetical protein
MTRNVWRVLFVIAIIALAVQLAVSGWRWDSIAVVVGVGVAIIGAPYVMDRRRPQ